MTELEEETLEDETTELDEETLGEDDTWELDGAALDDPTELEGAALDDEMTELDEDEDWLGMLHHEVLEPEDITSQHVSVITANYYQFCSQYFMQ